MNARIVNNTLYLEGSLDKKTTRQALQQVKHEIKNNMPAMIDLSGVSSLDSAGVAC